MNVLLDITRVIALKSEVPHLEPSVMPGRFPLVVPHSASDAQGYLRATLRRAQDQEQYNENN
jgi:hypothetical protein